MWVCEKKCVTVGSSPCPKVPSELWTHGDARFSLDRHTIVNRRWSRDWRMHHSPSFIMRYPKTLERPFDLGKAFWGMELVFIVVFAILFGEVFKVCP